VTGHRAAVLGHPVAHSLSPVLHRAAYVALGLTDWTYQAIDVDEPDLPAFLAERGEGWVGWSITMPLKRAVRPLLVHEVELARRVGAVNTVLVTRGGLEGFNTDVHGMVAACTEAHIALSDMGTRRSGVVIGSGATAASALAALLELGCSDPVVHVRSSARSADLHAAADRLGVRVRTAPFDVDAIGASIRDADVVVSTLPSGAADPLAVQAAEAAAARRPVLLDVVYDPWPTVLAQAWSAVGAPVVGGFTMLLHQAWFQVELMTGRPAPLEAMRAAGEAALAERAASSPA
jgi:shikimate dehydrogenase